MAEFDETKPSAANTVTADLQAIRDNWAWILDFFTTGGQLFKHNYKYKMQYTGEKLTGVLVKDDTGATIASAVLTYSGDNLTNIHWDGFAAGIDYDITYVAGNVDEVTCQISIPL